MKLYTTQEIADHTNQSYMMTFKILRKHEVPYQLMARVGSLKPMKIFSHADLLKAGILKANQ